MSKSTTTVDPVALRDDLQQQLEDVLMRNDEVDARHAQLTREGDQAEYDLAAAYVSFAEGKKDAEKQIAEMKRRRAEISSELQDLETRRQAILSVRANVERKVSRLVLARPEAFAAEAAPAVERAEAARKKALTALGEFSRAMQECSAAWRPLTAAGLGYVGRSNDLTGAITRVRSAATLPDNLNDGHERDLRNLQLCHWLVDRETRLLPHDSPIAQKAVSAQEDDWRLLRGTPELPEGVEAKRPAPDPIAERARRVREGRDG